MAARLLTPLKRVLTYGNGYRNPIVRLRTRGHRLTLRHTLLLSILLSAVQATCLMNVIVIRPDLLRFVGGLSASGALIVFSIPLIVSLAAFGQTQRFAKTETFDLLKLSHLEEQEIVQGVMFSILHWTRDLLIVPVSILPLLAVGSMVGFFNANVARLTPSLMAANFGLITIPHVIDVGYATVVWGIAMWGIYLSGLWFGVGLGFRLDSAASGLAIIATIFMSIYLIYGAALFLASDRLTVNIVFCVLTWLLALGSYRYGTQSID